MSKRAIAARSRAPVDARLEVRRVALGAAGSNAATPRVARARQHRERGAASMHERDVARRGDVRRVAEEAEAGDVGGAARRRRRARRGSRSR